MQPFLFYPVQKPRFLSQGFGENLNGAYSTQGLIGHPGEDFVGDWKSKIYCAAENSLVTRVINEDNPDPQAYRAVYTIVERNGRYFEITYGHLEVVLVKVGQVLNPKDIVGLMGNRGMVFSFGREITRAEKEAGSKAATHLHFQVREMLKKNNGYIQRQPDNGFNSCINPQPLFTGRYAEDYVSYKNNLATQISLLQKVVGLLNLWVKKHDATN